MVGVAVAPSGNGYWLVGSDGGVFAFGTAVFQGSATGVSSSPVVGITAGAPGGYLLIASDGGVFNYGTPFFGSQAGIPLAAPVVAISS